MTVKDCLIKIQIDKEIRNLLTKQGAPEESIIYIDEKIAADKREYRKCLKLKSDNHYEDYANGFVVASGGDWDSWWMKVFFPNEHWSKEEMDIFIEYNWRHATPSQYDCTGQLFTWAIDCFNVPSGVVAYIREAIDV